MSKLAPHIAFIFMAMENTEADLKRKQRPVSQDSLSSVEFNSPDEKKCRNDSETANDEVMNALGMVENFAEKLNQILVKLEKLDHIELKLSEMDTRMVNLEVNLTKLSNKQSETDMQISNLKESVNFMCTESESLKADIKLSTGKMAQRLEELEKEVLYLNCYSRRENLNFFGIDEEDNEDVQDKLQTFLHNKLGVMHPELIELQRIHRLGPKRRDGLSRPIIARFLRYQERDKVIQAAYKLKNTKFKIMEDFPKKIIETRRHLVPILKDAKANGKKAHFSKSMPDKLIIDGLVYKDT